MDLDHSQGLIEAKVKKAGSMKKGSKGSRSIRDAKDKNKSKGDYTSFLPLIENPDARTGSAFANIGEH